MASDKADAHSPVNQDFKCCTRHKFKSYFCIVEEYVVDNLLGTEWSLLWGG